MTDPFIDTPMPGQPGWSEWRPADPTRFNTLMGPITYRVDAGTAFVRMTPEHRHSNVRDAVHGGVTLAFIDISLFAAARGFGLVTAGTAVTLGLDTQFIAEARLGEPLEARVELLRETGRLLFLRGLVVQGDEPATVAAFAATIRKPSPPLRAGQMA
ncbi:PaaI family thioesterase [Sphingomonas sp. 1P08PE]|uniref:PaaI family thioesterase n=1 Tax=Sphingomonas sp. 1P08PE TaxID=554122 RepID=UPI0039A35B08